jgi:sporulation protein YlmC with PRC-barrel domain
MLTEAELREVLGRSVLDDEGKTIGNLETFFRDRESGQPEWLGVYVSGMFRSHHRLVPVRGAEREGNEIHVPWTKGEVGSAPEHSDPDEPISEELEDQAYRHYKLERVTH